MKEKGRNPKKVTPCEAMQSSPFGCPIRLEWDTCPLNGIPKVLEGETITYRGILFDNLHLIRARSKLFAKANIGDTRNGEASSKYFTRVKCGDTIYEDASSIRHIW
jgi:hypothetical protein